jgi:hypothetical protein
MPSTGRPTRRRHLGHGFYVQLGALADLTGQRSRLVPPERLRAIYAAHPRHDVHRTVPQAIKREAKAVPGGRFELLSRCGLPLLVRISPTRKL